MKKHISEVEVCMVNHDSLCEISRDSCENYHKDEFCLLCGYFMEGDRLYMEIHGSNGALNRVKDIDSNQPYVCMECVGQFRINYDANYKWLRDTVYLTDFIKERYIKQVPIPNTSDWGEEDGFTKERRNK